MTDDNTTDQPEPKKETAAEIYASRGRKPIRGAAIDDRPPTEVTHTSNWSTGATALIGVATAVIGIMLGAYFNGFLLIC